MASPLSPAQNSALNIIKPTTTTPQSTRRRFDSYDGGAPDTTKETPDMSDDYATAPGNSPGSVPFRGPIPSRLSNASSDSAKENVMSPSPAKSVRHSRVLSGNELSPLKILSSESMSGAHPSADARQAVATNPAVAAIRSPRKSMSPIKRFPIRVNSPREPETPSRQQQQQQPQQQQQQQQQPKQQSPVQPRELTLEDAIRENHGLERAIQILEDEDSALEGADDYADDITLSGMEDAPGAAHENYYDDTMGHDDTMTSTFSTFSAVPNLTMFANLNNNQSPSRLSTISDMTPRPTRQHGHTVSSHTPRGAPTPQQYQQYQQYQQHQDSGNTTNLLMEFTDQLRYPQKTPTQRPAVPGRPMSFTGPTTPSRASMNLIDFDIPPMPTPRSIPSITPRELESLKSNFLSEISSLKASLSGKEAEVSSLKTAVAGAERRAGESMEQLREERSTREHLAAERDDWERRGREMESVLRKAKEEIMLGQREREELETKLEESEKRREAAEMMAQEAESKIAGMKAGKATEEKERAAAGSPAKNGAASSSSAKEVEIAVERVARELHALYKSKHETKVTALKKSYESRWERRVCELEARITELGEENDRMRLGRDATMTRVDPGQAALDEERRAQAAQDQAHIRELAAEVEKLEAVVEAVRGDNSELRGLLEQERVEKGELVQLAEEMMSMQQSFVASTPAPVQAAPPREAPAPAPAASTMRTPGANRGQQAVDNLRSSIGRGSGLRAPGSYAGAPAGRGGGGPGLPRPRSMLPPRSGIMSSIERMGSHRGRGD